MVQTFDWYIYKKFWGKNPWRYNNLNLFIFFDYMTGQNTSRPRHLHNGFLGHLSTDKWYLGSV